MKVGKKVSSNSTERVKLSRRRRRSDQLTATWKKELTINWHQCCIPVCICIQYLFLGVLLCISLLSFYLTHRQVSSTAAASGTGPPSSYVRNWLRTVDYDTQLIESQLRTATDSMKLQSLRRAIAEAEALHYDGPPLKTAKFVRQHLSEEHMEQLKEVKNEKMGEKKQVVEQNRSISEPSAPLSSSSSADKVLVSHARIGGGPKVFDWWTSPPSALQGLLPSFPEAALFEKIAGEDESRIARRHGAILQLAGETYQPSKFPIGIVAYNRPELLRTSIASLLEVRGIDKSQITLYQDGADPAVRQVAIDAGIKVKQHHGNQNAPGQEGAAQIARHYKWTFTSMFEDNPQADYAIVVEDDMIFANDFLSFFAQLAPLYDRDPTVYCITSWNDNAQKGLALDPRVILRTDFFIGLGWMISRKIYKGELEQKWPNTHWDHWLRDPAQRRGRQCVYPEVTRNFNIGKFGTHSDDALYSRYFQKIVLNQQPAVWLGHIDRLIANEYDDMLMKRVQSALQVTSLGQFMNYTHTDFVLFLQINAPNDPQWERTYAPFFGLWHSVPFIRGIYQSGVVYLRWHTNYLFLVNSNSMKYVSLRHPSSPIFDASAFQIPIESLTIIQSQPGGENCNQACQKVGLTCSKLGLARINKCEVMEVRQYANLERRHKDSNSLHSQHRFHDAHFRICAFRCCPLLCQSHFHCSSCGWNLGTDQPAYVHKPELPNFGACLINSQPPDCSGGHTDTTRLCACVPAE